MDYTAEAKNTDRELWREREGDYYAASIHVTEGGGIGIDVGGTVVVRPIREWHELASWKCKAQPRAAVPSDCNHPFCGCDPHAERIIAELQECGWGPLPRKRPVAWRVKDGEGWIIFKDEAAAYQHAQESETALQGLYVRDGT